MKLRFAIQEAKTDWDKLSNYLQGATVDFNPYIEIFRNNKQRLLPEERDIYYWLKRPAEDFIIRMLDLKNTTSRNAEKESSKKVGASKVWENKDFLILHIKDYSAAKYYGKNTKWCISGNFAGNENKGEYYFNTYQQLTI